MITLAATTGMTSGRLGPTLTALVGLAAVALALRALRSASRRTALAARTLGALSLTAGTIFAVTAAGGPGTGNGIVGAWAAMGLGLAAAILGGRTLNRRSRAGG
ncbi:DUF6223 family protein [Nocardia sp. NPDC127579]|uniref:DUF6223 family protein n=1 Tax=Nocardia sp. NPDC127579 TaxID=3345402 RepID=UPI00363F9B5A